MQTSKVRPEPKIPDHEVLRKIGGGAYGEVWLARGVTGALRAVKTVWHNDFEDQRGFEREFEGILKYEPISRDHPGLVHILHVGRSECAGEPFYFYVMELGDDVVKRREISPVEYEPRTLRSDMKAAEGKALDVEDCITAGRLLAEALDHLHTHGLAHRDVKPSNVIFVDGKAKLADIGLVALRGQQTFVGTEGFVPPEGPGSSQADVYSLGKVLYEMATGKDRLEFPELPDELPEGSKLKRWRLLNSVICDVCEPKLSRRKIRTAGDLAAELARLEAGRRRPMRVKRGLVAGVLATAAGVVGATQLINWRAVEIPSQPAIYQPPEPVPMGLVKVRSQPPGATVRDEEGKVIGVTDTKPVEYPVESIVGFTLELPGYRPKRVEGEVVAGGLVLYAELTEFRPPEREAVWMDAFGAVYQPDDDHHVSTYYVNEEGWERFRKATKENGGKIVSLTQNGEMHRVVLATRQEAQRYVEWLEAQCRESHLADEHWMEFVQDTDRLIEGANPAQEMRPFWCVVRAQQISRKTIGTNPPGADVYVDGENVGVTTEEGLEIEVVLGKETRVVELIFEKQGYERRSIEVPFYPRPAIVNPDPDKQPKPDPGSPDAAVASAESEVIYYTLELENILTAEMENSLGMKFVPVGEGPDFLAGVWETRIKDYAEYVKANRGKAQKPIDPGFPQESDLHPVVNVTKEEAEAFCAWLTTREHKRKVLDEIYEYRLPTDTEWSRMAGLGEKEAEWPMMLDQQTEGFYWGADLWPPNGTGNFADASAELPPDKVIAGYEDNFPYTAPVGSFAPRKVASKVGTFELYDLEGNVREWVSDDYNAEGKWNVGRGGSWRSHSDAHLMVSMRWTEAKHANPLDDDDEFSDFGFRVVLAKVPVKPEKESAGTATAEGGPADKEPGAPQRDPGTPRKK